MNAAAARADQPVVVMFAYLFDPAQSIGAVRPFRFYKYLREMGYDLETLPYPEWLVGLREAPPRGDDAVGGLLRGSAPAEEEVWDRNAYDDRNTRRTLEGSDLRRPKIDANLFKNYAWHFAQQGWIKLSPALSGAGRSSR